ELTESEREEPRRRERARVEGEHAGERRGSHEAWIAKAFHPRHGVVERVVTAVPAAETELGDGRGGEAEKGRRVAREARQGRIAGSLGERPAGGWVSDEREHLRERSAETGGRTRVEVVRTDAGIHVHEGESRQVPARKTFLDPPRGAQHAELLAVEEREHDGARGLPAAPTEARESRRGLEHGGRAGGRVDRPVNPRVRVVAENDGGGLRGGAGDSRNKVGHRGTHRFPAYGHAHARRPRPEIVGSIEETLPVWRRRRAGELPEQHLRDVLGDRERRDSRQRVDTRGRS